MSQTRDDEEDDGIEIGDVVPIAAFLPRKPAIQTRDPDGPLRAGDLFRITHNGLIYRVRDINQSRAWCVPVRKAGLEFPKTGTYDDDFAVVGGISISPNACVIRVDPGELEPLLDKMFAKSKPLANEKRDSMASAAVGIPVPTKSAKDREKERKASIASKAAVAPPKALVGAAKAAKDRAAKSPRPPKTVRQCACGCGEETSSYFVPGHDARFKAWMTKVERGTMPVEELPKSVQKAYEFKKKGKGFVTTLNYKGEKHTGYDTKA